MRTKYGGQVPPARGEKAVWSPGMDQMTPSRFQVRMGKCRKTGHPGGKTPPSGQIHCAASRSTAEGWGGPGCGGHSAGCQEPLPEVTHPPSGLKHVTTRH